MLELFGIRETPSCLLQDYCYGHPCLAASVALTLRACLQAYLEEMAAMLIQAQGDGGSQAGQRLQRLTTELVAPSLSASCSRPQSLHCNSSCVCR